ncbi:MAG: aminotransferase class I/II-fold pyridoxal phosphate-dependent enzyme [Hyphomicrobiaceae bacterium TMED74]|nr:cystathionine gamma-synthase [Filomicrobium sp.]RPG46453.1 MAG: aminotransferase class I/II-fold pyridoxal phosphate-dependent enzyme [Hyphomicrobiaceae bacterium TMED74]
MSEQHSRSAATIAAQALHIINEETGGVVPGIELATTFARDDSYEFRSEFGYSRDSNPTTRNAEKIIKALSGAEDALVFNSGMSAISTVYETLRPGQHVVAPIIMYHGAQHWLQHLEKTRGIELTLFDQTKQGALKEAIKPGKTELVWIESPVNPTWDVIDIAEAADLAHEAGATLGLDTTVAPPCTTDAFALGADIVFQSATKYLGGHSDLTGGVLTTAKNDDRWQEIQYVRKHLGGILQPFEAWLLIRGIRTLFVRFERASQNAMALARHFENHPKVERALYPGLENYPGHEIAARQMTNGFGGMMSLLIKGDEAEARATAAACRVFMPATSLGGVESLIEHRKTVEGPDSAVPDNLLRLSVGIEGEQDLIADIEQALGQKPSVDPRALRADVR